MLKKPERGFGIISEEDAHAVLAPYHPQLFQVVTRAWTRFQDGPIRLTPTPTIGYWTNTMHALMADGARELFADAPGVEILDGKNFLLRVGDGVLLRFKKVSGELLTSNYPTRRSAMQDAQLHVPDLPPLPNVTVGYQPNRAWSDLESVCIVLAKKKQVMWNYELVGTIATTEAFSPLVDKVFVRPKAQSDLFRKPNSE